MTAGRLVDQFVERVWRRRDLDGIVDLFAEDYELATVAGGQVRAQRAGRLPAG